MEAPAASAAGFGYHQHEASIPERRRERNGEDKHFKVAFRNGDARGRVRSGVPARRRRHSVNVDVTELFWEAWENPETFDANLSSMPVPGRAAECLRRLADGEFAAADAQVQNECSFC